jgi:hypothetical protein
MARANPDAGVTASAPVRAATFALRLLLAAAILMREVAACVGGPLWRLIARLRLLAWLSAWVGALQRYSVLAVLAAPLAIAEPLKVAGLYALATGHVGWGVALQVAGHGLSLLLVERIIDAGHAQLMTFGWFAALHRAFVRVRAASLAWPPVRAAREAALAVASAVSFKLGLSKR